MRWTVNKTMHYVKKLLLFFDRKFFDNFFSNNFSKEVRAWKAISKIYPFTLKIAYAKQPNDYFNHLCDLYGSDKGEVSGENQPYDWNSHSYADFYTLVFGFKKNSVTRVLECGIGTNNTDVKSNMGARGRPGASLRVWRDYFPNAQIIGIDIDERILFDEDRITTFLCDQTSVTSIVKFISEAGLEKNSFDIIVDDGLHTFIAGRTFFESIIDYLSSDGMYVIEDVKISDKNEYLAYFGSLKEVYTARFVDLKRPGMRLGDNSIIAVTKT